MTTYTPSVPVIRYGDVPIGESKIFSQTVTRTDPTEFDAATSTKENTAWSVDGENFYTKSDGEVLLGIPLGTLSFTMWVKFTPVDVNDTPGTIIIGKKV